VRVGFVRVELDRSLDGLQGFRMPFLLQVDRPQIHERRPEVISLRDCLLQQRKSLFGAVELEGDVSQVGERLGVIRVERELALELAPGVVVLAQLPVEETEAKVDVRLAGGDLDRLLEFRHRLRSPPHTVERLPGQNVSGG